MISVYITLPGTFVDTRNNTAVMSNTNTMLVGRFAGKRVGKKKNNKNVMILYPLPPPRRYSRECCDIVGNNAFTWCTMVTVQKYRRCARDD